MTLLGEKVVNENSHTKEKKLKEKNQINLRKMLDNKGDRFVRNIIPFHHCKGSCDGELTRLVY